MVAPSFQSFKILTDTPFLKNGKLYVKILNEKTGSVRSCRWYSQEEYNKAYANKGKNAPTNKKYVNGLRDARGFKQGPILLIRNNYPKDEEWLKMSPARYAVDFGWHIASTDTLPSDAPANFKYLVLSWDEICDTSDPTNNTSIPREQITALVQQKVKNKEFIKFG